MQSGPSLTRLTRTAASAQTAPVVAAPQIRELKQAVKDDPASVDKREVSRACSATPLLLVGPVPIGINSAPSDTGARACR